MVSTSAPIDRVVTALEQDGRRPKRNGNGYMALCPAHPDSKPSLSIGTGDGERALVHCHAGCTDSDVLAALGLKASELFADEPKQSSRPKAVATYTYTDEDGEPLYQVVKTEPKGFWQRRPDGTPGLGNARSVPYRLPELIAADPEAPVFVCEGEKDAEAIRREDCVATCNSGGAGKWHPEFAEFLAGREVIIVVDRDRPGYRHGRDVYRSVVGKAKSVLVCEPTHGKDVAEHLGGGLSLEALEVIDIDELELRCEDAPTEASDPDRDRRHVDLTSAAAIKVSPVLWLWRGRMPVGELSLFAGREDLGKSTVSYTLAAWITRGVMEGAYFGQPRAVLVAATEDSWEHTVVPRLMAAGADLNLVYRIDVVTSEGFGGYLDLPADLPALEVKAREVGAALLLLDPLISRLSAALDSHKDQEVRQALEPLVGFLQRTGMAGLGLIHLNKGTSADTLSSIMASRAFVAVARAVLFAVKDPEDESRRILGNEKNNLGRSDLPTLSYRIVGEKVAETDDGPVWTGRIEWGEESDRSVSEVMATAVDAGEGVSAVGEATDWLEDYLTLHGGSKASSICKRAGKEAGHSLSALKRASAKLNLEVRSEGFPRETVWSLPGRHQSAHQSAQSLGESEPTELNGPTGSDQGVLKPTVGPVGSVGSVGSSPTRGEPTAEGGDSQ
jgi:AAA domain